MRDELEDHANENWVFGPKNNLIQMDLGVWTMYFYFKGIDHREKGYLRRKTTANPAKNWSGKMEFWVDSYGEELLYIDESDLEELGIMLKKINEFYRVFILRHW